MPLKWRSHSGTRQGKVSSQLVASRDSSSLWREGASRQSTARIGLARTLMASSHWSSPRIATRKLSCSGRPVCVGSAETSGLGRSPKEEFSDRLSLLLIRLKILHRLGRRLPRNHLLRGTLLGRLLRLLRVGHNLALRHDCLSRRVQHDLRSHFPLHLHGRLVHVQLWHHHGLACRLELRRVQLRVQVRLSVKEGLVRHLLLLLLLCLHRLRLMVLELRLRLLESTPLLLLCRLALIPKLLGLLLLGHK